MLINKIIIIVVIKNEISMSFDNINNTKKRYFLHYFGYTLYTYSRSNLISPREQIKY